MTVQFSSVGPGTSAMHISVTGSQWVPAPQEAAEGAFDVVEVHWLNALSQVVPSLQHPGPGQHV